MKILHLSTATKGGAACTAIRIHEALMDHEVHSEMLTASPASGQINNSHHIQPSYSRLIQQLKYLKIPTQILQQSQRHQKAISGRAYRGVRQFNAIKTDYRITQHPSYLNADIIHLHWVANFLDWNEFFTKNTKPVVWSPCDINPITAGCHYSGDCLQFTTEEGCNKCPHLRGAKNQKYAQKNFASKRHLIANAQFPICFAPPAKWMAEMVHSSSLFGENAQTTILPHMSDEEVYRPLPVEFCRNLLNLPPAKKYILFSGDTGTSRKGFDLLLEAWEKINDPSVALLQLSGLAPFHREAVNTDNHIFPWGDIKDEKLLAAMYAAVDAVVVPSLDENLALTFIDSQLCGTPAITFDIGGFKDHIIDGKNGLNAGEPNASNLANALNEFLKNSAQFDRQQIAADGLKRYGQKNLVPKYIDLYQSMLN